MYKCPHHKTQVRCRCAPLNYQPTCISTIVAPLHPQAAWMAGYLNFRLHIVVAGTSVYSCTRCMLIEHKLSTIRIGSFQHCGVVAAGTPTYIRTTAMVARRRATWTWHKLTACQCSCVFVWLLCRTINDIHHIKWKDDQLTILSPAEVQSPRVVVTCVIFAMIRSFFHRLPRLNVHHFLHGSVLCSCDAFHRPVPALLTPYRHIHHTKSKE